MNKKKNALLHGFILSLLFSLPSLQGVEPGKVSFEIYYGRPYDYAPYYIYYPFCNE